MKGTYLGEFEELVLLTIGVLYDNAYGVMIKKELENQAGRKISIGAVHAAVNRLEDKAYLESYFGEPSKERGGKRKKFYKVTTYGQKVLKESMEMRQRLWKQIPDIAFDIKPGKI
ncbi:helix-turn-helix transcriptional regulator [Chondrinema litorale]|uniref:helix-turn-helix transcriptional regulator n=1 Tax=Chondrinema litorale TaxID=2994555 RepID=UPI00254330BA|nr:MarR family winged helix-turn-helix transcriptional regulator [Chondrinema litorale]UZR97996.1 MarR family winged helix-turn-helix transcriptional regulator [Chondrinema litorale]